MMSKSRKKLTGLIPENGEETRYSKVLNKHFKRQTSWASVRAEPDTPKLLKPKPLSELGDKAFRCDQCPYEQSPYYYTRGFKRYRFLMHYILEKGEWSRTSHIVHGGILGLILISTLSFILETIPAVMDWEGWTWIEYIIVAVFTMEYVFRLACCAHPWKFVSSWLNFIDLLAILPFYLELTFDLVFTAGSFRIFRVIRLARVFRLFKNPKLSIFMNVMLETLRRSSDSFGLIGSLVFLATIVFSSIMYYLERGVFDTAQGIWMQGDIPSKFVSIPAAMYWAIVTQTTIGYGDIVPVTTGGKCVATLTMFTGILVLAFPIIIIGVNFDVVYAEYKATKTRAKRREKEQKNENNMKASMHMNTKIVPEVDEGRLDVLVAPSMFLEDRKAELASRIAHVMVMLMGNTDTKDGAYTIFSEIDELHSWMHDFPGIQVHYVKKAKLQASSFENSSLFHESLGQARASITHSQLVEEFRKKQNVPKIQNISE